MLYTLKEHQDKKLFPKELMEQAGVIGKIKPDTIKVLNESAKGKSKRKLIVKMEAIHVGRTKNFTYYTEEGLKAGLKSWTQPYNKPVLTHHNEYRGEPIGRILSADYSEQTISGRPGLIFTVEITDADAIEKVLDGRYQTVSIGASTDKVTCNICGTDRTEEYCGHYPGEKYEEQTCHMIVGSTYGREVSYVNTPADENAGNRTVEIVDENTDPKESVHMEMYQMAEGLYQNVNQPDVNLYEHLNDDLKGLLNSMVNVNEGSGQQVPDETNPQVPQTNEGNPPEGQAPANPTEGNPEGPQAGAPEPAAANPEESNPPAVPAEPTPAATTPVQEGELTLAEAQVEIATLKGQVGEMQKTITNLVMKESKTASKLSEMTSDHDALVKENAKLVETAHNHLVEKVVELKLSLRKSDVVGVTKEDAIAAHLTRTKESLTDSLTDLLAEAKQVRPVAGTITNPGAGDTQESNNNGEKSMTIEEGAKLLSGMFKRKR
jgi:hypothetical protein